MHSETMQTESDVTTQTTNAEPSAHTRPSGSLGDRLTDIAAEEFGINRKLINFPPISIPNKEQDGDLYITDLNNVVRYNVTTGEFRTTRYFEEAVEVVNHNQHEAVTLEMIILGDDPN